MCFSVPDYLINSNLAGNIPTVPLRRTFSVGFFPHGTRTSKKRAEDPPPPPRQPPDQFLLKGPLERAFPSLFWLYCLVVPSSTFFRTHILSPPRRTSFRSYEHSAMLFDELPFRQALSAPKSGRTLCFHPPSSNSSPLPRGCASLFSPAVVFFSSPGPPFPSSCLSLLWWWSQMDGLVFSSFSWTVLAFYLISKRLPSFCSLFFPFNSRSPHHQSRAEDCPAL